VLSAAALSIAAGFAQFSVTTSLPDVAAAFGEITSGGSIAEQAGLSATTLGVGLGVIRLASLAAQPLAALADHRGRRRVVLGCCAAGLAISALAALAPSYWAFVAIVALSRPALSATNAVAGVLAAEEVRSRDRAAAGALVTAGYGTGAGASALVRPLLGEAAGFRGLFALSAVLLLFLPLVARHLEEPARFRALAGSGGLRRQPVLRAAGPEARRRLAVLGALTVAVTFLTGPVNTLLFLFGENVVGLSESVTAAAVVAAAPIGAVSLLAGRWCADRGGRIPTAATAHLVLCGAAVWVYSGSAVGVVGGYLVTIVAGSVGAPALAAIYAELFPTSMRGAVNGALTVAGVVGAVLGLIVFGMLTDVVGDFGLAAAAVAAPVALCAVLYRRLPETRGMELEESAPEGT